MRVLTWNVAGRVKAVQAQIELVTAFGADIVCLQEITPSSAAAWTQALQAAGLHVELSTYPVEPAGSRRLGVLIAARDPVEPVQVPGLPWPERHLAARTGGVEVHTLHAP